MRNPTRFHFDAHDARVRRLRQLFRERAPRVEPQQGDEHETDSPPLDMLQDAQPELAI